MLRILPRRLSRKGNYDTMFLFISGKLVFDSSVSRAAGMNVYAQIGVGDLLQMKANGAKEFTWSSSDTEIATVADDGMVQGQDFGTAMITAKGKGVKNTLSFKMSL